MPHVFQLFLFHPAASDAIKRTGAFVQKIVPEPTNDAASCSSNSSFSSPHSSFSSSHQHREKDVNALKQKKSSSSILVQEYLDEELDEKDGNGEVNYFTNRNIDVKGNCKRTNDILDEGTLREWVNMLGKLPDLEAHPEFMDI
jgi:hypothetical protein